MCKQIVSVFFLAAFTTVFAAQADFEAANFDREKIRKMSARIDTQLQAIHTKKKITPKQVVADSVYVRRVYLDLAGRVPTYEETTAFLESKETDKREKLVYNLLQSDWYVSHFFNYWATLLRINTYMQGMPDGAYELWVKRALQENMPYDVMVRKLVTASGSALENGAVGFVIRDREQGILDHVSQTSQVFLGSQIGCAMCHDAKFEKWKQREFYSFSAYFSEINMRKDGDIARAMRQKMNGATPAEVNRIQADLIRLPFVVEDKPGKQLKLPLDYVYEPKDAGKPVIPAVLYGKSPEGAPTETRRQIFAKWLTSPENPNFTRVIANRLWGKIFGMALVEPVNDMSENNPPVYPELMEDLTRIMVDLGYDMRSYLAVLVNTKTYQRDTSEKMVMHETFAYESRPMRRMTAEQLWDSLLSIYGVQLETNEMFYSLAKKRVIDSIANLGSGTAIAYGGESLGSALAMNVNVSQDVSVRNGVGGSSMMGNTGSGMNPIAMAPMSGMDGGATMGGSSMSGMSGGGSMMGGGMMSGDMMGSGSKDTGGTNGVGWNYSYEAAYNKIAGKRYGFAYVSDLFNPIRYGHFLEQFGISTREVVGEGNVEPSIAQSLTLMNGPEVGRLTYGNPKENLLLGRLQKIQDPAQLARTLYLSILSREPTEAESVRLAEYITENRKDGGLADMIWALANSREFVFIQ